MLKQLRLKFICITMVIVTVLLCTIFGLILHFTHENMVQSSLKVMDSVEKGPIRPPEKPGSQPRVHHFTLSQGPDGSLTLRGSAFAQQYTQEDLQHFWNTAQASEKRQGILRQYALRFYPEREPKNGIVFVDISAELAAMNALWQSSCAVAVAIWIAMLAVSSFLANWAIRPVERAWEQQRQFVADASHELKTPLTVIMTNAELLEDAGCPEESRRQSVGSILTMSQQMRRLVEGLLELARADNGTMQTHFERINLSAALSHWILPFDALFFERELVLDTRLEPNVFVSGSLPHLRQVAEILLDNAQKYSAAPAQVMLTLESRGKYALLRLETPGAPLSREQRKKIFERFYKVDQARTRCGSYGLGLAIAQQIVLNHKGKIWAEASDHANIFCIQLPMA